MPPASVSADEICGSCLCDAIQITMKRPADVEAKDWRIKAHNCHCEACSRTGGSLVTTWLNVHPDLLMIDDPMELIRTYESSPGIKRTFCSKCFTKLTWASDKISDNIEPSIVLFLRDDDDGKTNSALSKIVYLSSDQTAVEDKRNLVLMEDSPGGGFASLLSGEGGKGIEADEQIKDGKFAFACHCGTVAFETDINVRFSSCACKSDTRVANGLLWTGIMYKGDGANLPDTVTKHGDRSFCAKCGSYIAFDPLDGPHTIVSMANLTDFRRFRPEKDCDYIHLADQRGLVLQDDDDCEDGGLCGILAHHDQLKRFADMRKTPWKPTRRGKPSRSPPGTPAHDHRDKRLKTE